MNEKRKNIWFDPADDLGVVRSCGKHLVAFPAAEGDQANSQQASSLRLVDF